MKESLLDNNIENNNYNENIYINNENYIENTPNDYSENNIKDTLINMGFEDSLVTIIFNNIHPLDIQEALDYLNQNEQGLFTHSYIVNDRFVCSICGKGRGAHVNEALFLEPINNDNNDNNNLNNNLINNEDITFISNSNSIDNDSSSRKSTRNIFESYYNRTKLNNKNLYPYKTCGICEEKINENDINKIKIKCNHVFCKDCWLNYLEEKINNANVVKILCMQSGCGIVLEQDFIKKILDTNTELINKYNKFLERQNLLQSNKNFKFCPFPDCDGYIENKEKKQYVICNFGHEFCFNFLNKPHGMRKFSEIIDKEF